MQLSGTPHSCTNSNKFIFSQEADSQEMSSGENSNNRENDYYKMVPLPISSTLDSRDDQDVHFLTRNFQSNDLMNEK